MIKLSIIIVNYNVQYFLEQCIYAVLKATENIPSEIFVVDNNSTDGSVEMVKKQFSDKVILIANKENVGFSKANNQAIKVAKGEYVLLLNPDTVVEEDTFTKCIEFMDEHPDAGGLGVKMIDGKGVFLPESKRGLPTPLVAFYKIFGLSTLFPKSKRFGKYHLGYLNDDEIHEIEILSGAYMWLRKKVLDEIGYLDETFFMYGEDIDLSYRVTQAGYKNYYFPKARIIHYKGESTKKSSINYVFVFYNAMIIFAKKHFSSKNAKLFSLLINLAIYFRAFIAILTRFFTKIWLVLLDAAILLFGFLAIKKIYLINHPEISSFPESVDKFLLPVFALFIITSLFFNGGYDKPYNLKKTIESILWGNIIVLIVYALLDESYRFSRAVVMMCLIWSIVGVLLIRLIFYLLKIIDLNDFKKRKVAVIGDKNDIENVLNLPSIKSIKSKIYIAPKDENLNVFKYTGKLYQLEDLIDIYGVNELIFCTSELNYQTIIELMLNFKNKSIEYKIASNKKQYIIGSQTIESDKIVDITNINFTEQLSVRFSKRIVDVLVCIILLILYPLIFSFYKQPKKLLKNIFEVLIAKKNWINVFYNSNNKYLNGVITPEIIFKKDKLESTLFYLKNFSAINDLFYVISNFKKLDN